VLPLPKRFINFMQRVMELSGVAVAVTLDKVVLSAHAERAAHLINNSLHYVAFNLGASFSLESESRATSRMVKSL
jgi:hypothetical protein